MKNDTLPVQVILYEGIGATPWDSGCRVSVTANLLDQGYSVLRITPSGGPSGWRMPDGVPVVVLGSFTGPRPEIVGGAQHIATRDTAGLDADGILALVGSAQEELGAGLNRPGEPGAWKPWFPVIDYDRCTNCMQCLSFCLFDVYGV
ncbi:MAG TPA: ferredoxin family protein, partial [Bacteroidia bacterium]|nr:ferredoxin family protein [Bacteroidia bacterium]